MNPDIEIDRTLRQWLEEGPSELPDRVLDETAAQLDAVGQRRPGWHRWTARRDPVTRLLVPVAAVVALAVVAAAYVSLSGAPAVGDLEAVRYTSERHGYSLLLPDKDSFVVELPGAWVLGESFDEGRWGGDAAGYEHGRDAIVQLSESDGRRVWINSQEIPRGMTFEAWHDQYDEALARWFAHCPLVAAEEGLMGGERARFARFTCDGADNAMEVTALHNGRAYALRVFGVPDPDWDPLPIVNEWLARLSFTD